MTLPLEYPPVSARSRPTAGRKSPRRRVLAEASVDGLVSVDADLRITDVNETLARMMGRPRSDLLGSWFPDCFVEREEAIRSVGLTLEIGRISDYVLTLRSASGARVPVAINAVVAPGGDSTGPEVVASARDVTDQLELERQLRDIQHELELKNVELARANRDKDRFLAIAERLLDEPTGARQGTAVESETARADRLQVLSAKLHGKVSELERVGEERRRLQARLRELLERTTAAQEQERRHIAADVHDDSIQVIAAVGFQIEALRSQITDEAHLRLLGGIAETVRLAGSRLRALVFDLRPPVLDLEGGLPNAIREYLEKTPAESRLAFDVRGQISSPMSPELRLLLYRIAQEALINVHKHARASRVDVEVGEVDGGVRVSVSDDGRGMDPSRLESVPGHLGVTAMRERAETAGGWWRCESVPGAGTRVEFWVPV